MLAALVGVAATAPAAWSTFPGLNGPLAYEADGTASPNIFAIQPLAVSLGAGTRLTSADATDRDAAWSDDGRKIAFMTERDGNAEIYLMNADGSAQTRLTTDPAFDADPTLSPDGTRVAFNSTRDGNTEIYVMGLDGSALTRLTFDPAVDQQADWSPDGTRIAFESKRDGNMEIYTMNPDGSAVTRLTFAPEADADPSWSPDGASIAYASGPPDAAKIFVLRPGTPGRTRLTRGFGDHHFPAWSPDGQEIAFTSGFASTSIAKADAGGAEARIAASGIDAAWGPLPPPDPVPQLLKTVNLTPSGTVFVRVKGAAAAAPLVDPREIPVGSTIDTRRGEVEIEAATANERSTSSVIVSQGRATLSQTGGRDPVTVLRLSRTRCPRGGVRRNRLRAGRLRTRGRGSVRTRARFSAATARGGADWLTVDRCDGTLTKVTSGRVTVRNLRRREQVLVRAGGSFLATASRGRCRRPRCRRLGIITVFDPLRGGFRAP